MIMHKNLEPDKWFKLSVIEQLANVGSDIERTISWKKKGNQKYSQNAFFRALELIDLTVEDPKNKKRLKEILRAREMLVDHFMFNNAEYNTTEKSWQKYFYHFTYAAAIQRGR